MMSHLHGAVGLDQTGYQSAALLVGALHPEAETMRFLLQHQWP